MKTKIDSMDVAYLALFIFLIAGAYGWVSNVIKVIAMLDGSVTAMFVARIVGVFAAPLGAVLGYF